MVDSRFEELDLDEAELVVEALELTEKAVDEGEGFVVGLLGHVEGDQADLEILALEGTALGGGPFYAVFCNGNFDVDAVGNIFEEVQKLADYILPKHQSVSVHISQRSSFESNHQRTRHTELRGLGLGKR
jgi:hypothetical protein